MANLALTLQCGSAVNQVHGRKRVTTMDGVYQCKTCQREFSSFQALGGHRTSHKRVRARAEGLNLVLGPIKKVKTSHECAICGTGFTMGQALGGHMRRHRSTVDRAHEESGLDLVPLEYGVHELEVHKLEGSECRLLPLFV